MMLGRERAVVAECLRFDTVLDPIPVTGWAVRIRQSSFLACATEYPELH